MPEFMPAIKSRHMRSNGFSPAELLAGSSESMAGEDAIDWMDKDEDDSASNDFQRLYRTRSLRRTKKLLLAALRVWELKRGIRN